jgi:hypothetical protein
MDDAFWARAVMVYGRADVENVGESAAEADREVLERLRRANLSD